MKQQMLEEEVSDLKNTIEALTARPGGSGDVVVQG